VGKRVSEVHPNLRGLVDIKIAEPDYIKIGKIAKVVFVATPHGIAMKFVPKLLEGGAKVVDLSADYRFENVEIFERYYVKHESPQVKGVYGLPELHRTGIKRAKLVANPGCYPTAAILSMAPLIKRRLIDLDHIIIDAKTGTSGAGVVPSEVAHHPVMGANIRAYGATTHRHTPEINQELSKLAGQKVETHFTPHLIPIVRGILSTTHVFLLKPTSAKALLGLYRKSYAGEPFVRVLEELPQVNFVVGSNYCDIGFELDAKSNRLVVVAAIDNLIKGASGQAIQNMNLMFGFDETRGLEAPGLRP
ncbi:MAG: N-acetyl-gamma-glutamyl-phosphate reductase, partial [Candidatus Hadarchaeaceae archaeon]